MSHWIDDRAETAREFAYERIMGKAIADYSSYCRRLKLPDSGNVQSLDAVKRQIQGDRAYHRDGGWDRTQGQQRLRNLVFEKYTKTMRQAGLSRYALSMQIGNRATNPEKRMIGYMWGKKVAPFYAEHKFMKRRKFAILNMDKVRHRHPNIDLYTASIVDDTEVKDGWIAVALPEKVYTFRKNRDDALLDARNYQLEKTKEFYVGKEKV